jgi:hypothetical protein
VVRGLNFNVQAPAYSHRDTLAVALVSPLNSN